MDDVHETIEETHGLKREPIEGTLIGYEDESTGLGVSQRYALMHSPENGWQLCGVKAAFPYHESCENAGARAKRRDVEAAAAKLAAAFPKRGGRLTVAMADGLRALNRGVLEYRTMLFR